MLHFFKKNCWNYNQIAFPFLFTLSITQVLAQPVNNNPCTATPLTVNSSCVYTAGTTSGATAAVGVPAPGCASYAGADVWYSVVVPAGGVLNINTNTGGITDGGMAAYSGSCGSLALIECDDDDSPNGLMPLLNLTGLSPGNTIFLRFWKFGGGTGTFSICVSAPASSPPCGASPAAGNTCATATPICNLNGYCGNTSASYTANTWNQSCGFLGLSNCGLTGVFCGSIENNSFLSFTASATSISFDVWVNSSTMGYGIQILIFSASGGCSGTVTQYGPCYNPGTVQPGPVNITATGLTIGNSYYIMIDGNAGDVVNYTIGANTGISIPVSVTPATTSICPGQTIALTAAGGNGTYNWNATPQLNTTTGANVIATPPTTPGTYTYTANSATGNPLCPSSTSATATITVNSCGCTVTAGNSGPICSGGSLDLTATNVVGATYSWTGPSGFTSSSQNPVGIIPPSTPGTYDYIVTATVAGVPCTSTTTVTVNANPTIVANDVSMCAGGSVGVSAIGGSTYSWSPGTGLSATTGSSVTANPATTTIYTVTGTSASGCVSTDPVTVTVNPLPIVNAGIDQVVCAGASVTLSGGGASTYIWDNSIINGAAFNPANTTTYTVSGTSASGCVSTDQVLVTVNPIPTVDAGPDASICSGFSTTLTASGATTYSWSPGGQTTAAISVSPGTTTVYTVTGTSLTCTASDVVTVSVLTSATINAGVDVSLCAGQSTTLNASGGVTYTWDNSLGNGNGFNVTPASTTSYIVTGTDAGGCVGTDQITVTINANPTPSITGLTQYCTGNTANLSTNAPFTTYNWSTGASSASVNVTTADNPITVTVTNAFGCSATTAAVNVVENSLITNNITETICQGESILIFGNLESTAGVYSQTFTSTSGCDSTVNVTLNVLSLPTVNAGVDQAVCSGTSVTLTATGANNYSWDNSVSNGISFTPNTGTVTYTVIGTDASGCENTDQVDITVNSLPSVNAGQDQAVCIGESVTLTGTGASTYSWDNSVSDGVSFAPNATATYSVIGTSVPGCIGTDQVTITVNPIPTIFAGNDVIVCEGQPVTLTGTGGSTYTWDNGISNGNSFVPPIGNTSYIVTGTSVEGCTNTDQVNVVVNPLPIISFTPDVINGCVPLIVNFTNTTANSSNCVWTLSNGTVLTGCGIISSTFNQAGCYNVTLSATSNGCSNTFTANNLICVEEVPVASFSATPSVISEFNPLVNFTNNSIGASNYIWNFGDNSIVSTQMNPSYDYSAAGVGSYLVTLIASSPFGCSDTTYSTIQFNDQLIYYIPNTFTPDNDNFNQTFKPIFTSGFDPYDYTLLIFNRWGETIFESHNSEIGWDGTYGNNSEIQMVQEGSYVWKIEFKTNQTDERKLVIGHVNIIR